MEFYACNISDILFEKENSPAPLYALRISDPGWHTDSHSHPELTEIVYVASGKSRHIVNGTEYICYGSDIVVYLPEAVHNESLVDKESTVFYGIALKNFPADKMTFPVMIHSGKFARHMSVLTGIPPITPLFTEI